MVKFFMCSSVFIVGVSVTFSCWAADPCKPIALACMAEGYYKGGDAIGKGLAKNCVIPVISKKKTLQNDSFSDADLQQCKSAFLNENSIAL